MTTTGEKREEAARGDRARQLLDDAALQDAIKQLRETYAAEWRQSEPGDSVYRERLYLADQLVSDFIHALRTTIANGAVARDHLEHLQRHR